MRSSNAFPGVLPTLRPATDAATTTTTAAPSVHPATSSVTTTAVPLQDSTGKAPEYEEDWHRPPSDLTYLQDLLTHIDAQEQQLLASGRGDPGGAVHITAGLSTMAQRERAVEEQELAELRMREGQVAAVEQRRRRSRRRCDAVDAAFQQALQRRLHAMQHLAADPPAERLVGQSMMQYVPAALLPDDVVDKGGRLRPGQLPLAPRSAVESRMQRTATAASRAGNAMGTAGSGTLGDRPAGAVVASEQDAVVFLTQLDAGGRPVQRGGPDDGRSGSSSSSAPDASARRAGRLDGGGPASATRSPSAEARQEGGGGAGRAATADPLYDSDDDELVKGWARPATVTDANMAHWHELGYHVVVLGGDAGGPESAAVRRAMRAAAAAAAAAASTADGAGARASPANASTRRKRVGEASRGASGGAWEWMQLAPLPSVCLVQRRLPEEDMSVTALRETRQQGRPQREHGTPSATAPAAGAAERGGPMWRSSMRGGKPAQR